MVLRNQTDDTPLSIPPFDLDELRARQVLEVVKVRSTDTGRTWTTKKRLRAGSTARCLTMPDLKPGNYRYAVKYAAANGRTIGATQRGAFKVC